MWCCGEQMMYGDAKASANSRHRAAGTGLCCFDPSVGQLCVATAGRPGLLACMCPPKQASPRENGAQRYSCLRKLTLTEPDTVGDRPPGPLPSWTHAALKVTIQGPCEKKQAILEGQKEKRITVVQETLEVIFVMADGKGVLPLPNPYTPTTKPQQQLTRIHIAPCAATELKVTPCRLLHLSCCVLI